MPGQPGQAAAPAAHGHALAGQGYQAPNAGGVAGHGADPSAAAGAHGQQAGGWDQAAAAAYYQNQGWGGYYGKFWLSVVPVVWLEMS